MADLQRVGRNVGRFVGRGCLQLPLPDREDDQQVIGELDMCGWNN